MLIDTGLNLMRTVIAQNITCTCVCPSSTTTWYTSIPSIIITIVLLYKKYGCIKQFGIKAYKTIRHQMYRILEASISTTAAIRRPVDVLFATPTPTPNPTPQIEGDSASEVVPHNTLTSAPPTVALPSTLCVIDIEK